MKGMNTSEARKYTGHGKEKNEGGIDTSRKTEISAELNDCGARVGACIVGVVGL
jgi:hypothetical protein